MIPGIFAWGGDHDDLIWVDPRQWVVNGNYRVEYDPDADVVWCPRAADPTMGVFVCPVPQLSGDYNTVLEFVKRQLVQGYDYAEVALAEARDRNPDPPTDPTLYDAPPDTLAVASLDGRVTHVPLTPPPGHRPMRAPDAPHKAAPAGSGLFAAFRRWRDKGQPPAA